MGAQTGAWIPLRRHLQAASPPLYAVRPAAEAAADCAVCRGPVRAGFTRCYQCDRHDSQAGGLLADVVVPVGYAVKDTAFADDLARYKSWLAPAAQARASILSLLLTFLTDHTPCIWPQAGPSPPGLPAATQHLSRCPPGRPAVAQHAGPRRPGLLAVVPTGAGRPGPHPLLDLVSPYLRRPNCPLALRSGHQGRDLDLDRFEVLGRPAGASVLLLDDTWVSGASAQSAAAALKLAGARHVAVVVLGRHVNPADPASAALLASLHPARYDPSICAVHRPVPNGADRR
jgi:hypothetical protein